MRTSNQFGLVRKTLITVGVVLAGTMAGYAIAAADELARTDKSFLISAAEAGTTEIVASKSAQGKANSSAVKAFAATMLKDHTKVADELKQLASRKGVTVPDEPSKEQQAKIAKLNGLEGVQFDTEYANEIGVTAHKETVALFRKASKNAKDPDIKRFAENTLPGLERHLEMAESLKVSVTNPQ